MTQNLCDQVFSGQNSYPYNQAVEAIMRNSKKQETTAKKIFKMMRAHQMIIHGDDKNWRKST